MRTPLGAFYIDDVQLELSTDVLRLINRDPEPDSPATGVRGAPVDGPIRLWIAATGAFVLSATGTRIEIRITPAGGAAGPLNLIFTNDPTPTFSAGWTSSTFLAQTSPGGAAVDEHVFKLVRDGGFNSLDKIEVRVQAEATTGEPLDKIYNFTVEDLTIPVLQTVRTRGLRTVRVTYDEPVVQASGVLGDALLVEDVSGSVEFIPPDQIVLPKATLVAADVGLVLGVARAQNALNNGNSNVVEVLGANRLRVDRELVAEGPGVGVLATLGVYEFVHVPPPAPTIEPAFTPIVLSAAQPSAENFVEGTDLRSFVDLTLQDDLSPERAYDLKIAAVDDVFGNRATSLSKQFAAERLPRASRRRFTIFEDLIPPLNKREDDSGDLERFTRSLDEVYQLIRSDVDRLLLIKDVDLTPAKVLDVLLGHLGNPFSFTLTELEKRRLIDIIVELYKVKGLEDGIEDVLNFLIPDALSATCAPPSTEPGFDVLPFSDSQGTWVLGESALGIDTALGPGTSFLRFAFKVCSPIVLTDEQRFRVSEIVEYMKPAHTHFVQLEEPAPAPLPPSVGTPLWELGVSALGVDTTLDG